MRRSLSRTTEHIHNWQGGTYNLTRCSDVHSPCRRLSLGDTTRILLHPRMTPHPSAEPLRGRRVPRSAMSVSQCPAIPAFIPTRSNQKQRRAAQRLARAGFSMKNIPPAPPPPPPTPPQQPAPRTTVGTMNAALSTSTNTSPSENTANSNGDMADIAVSKQTPAHFCWSPNTRTFGC